MRHASPCQLTVSYCQRSACFLDFHQFYGFDTSTKLSAGKLTAGRVNLARRIHRCGIRAAPDTGGVGGVGSRAKNGAKRPVLVSNNIRLYLVHQIGRAHV